MSDIQDLIHKTSMDCIERGKIIERQRIIKLIQPHIERCTYKEIWENDCDVCDWVEQTIQEIQES
jgi:hypothetical protein